MMMTTYFLWQGMAEDESFDGYSKNDEEERLSEINIRVSEGDTYKEYSKKKSK